MYIKVFVIPDAKRESVVIHRDKKKKSVSRETDEGSETLAISVREPAVGNRANTRVREILAERFAVPVGKVRILTGHRSGGKMVSINS